MVRRSRIPFIFLALICLIAGLWTGLIRIGWDIAPLPSVIHHGALMVGGFLGTLITLEKVIPLKRKILYSFPVFSALSAALFSFSYQRDAIMFLIAGSAGLVLIVCIYLYRERSNVYFIMLGGALCWLVGNVLLFTESFYPLVVPWWIAFIVFVITSERIELMKFLPVTAFEKRILYALLGLHLISILFAFHGPGTWLYGGTLIAVAVWLMRYDVVGINIKKSGLVKFTGIALMGGYFALLLTGMFTIVSGDNWLSYDTVVHTFFLGFVFSMIFAHGPIILPGVLGISFKPYHRVLYLWLVILQASWVIRIVGNFSSDVMLRKVSGLASAVAILCYFITLALLIVRSRYAKV